MTETITPQQFHEAAGIEDWRVLTNVAHAHVRTACLPPRATRPAWPRGWVATERWPYLGHSGVGVT
jgi:hypothetical protein